MTHVKIIIQAAEFRICEQTDDDHPTVYTLENAETDCVIDGADRPEDLMSKLIRLSTVRLPEVQVS